MQHAVKSTAFTDGAGASELRATNSARAEQMIQIVKYKNPTKIQQSPSHPSA